MKGTERTHPQILAATLLPRPIQLTVALLNMHLDPFARLRSASRRREGLLLDNDGRKGRFLVVQVRGVVVRVGRREGEGWWCWYAALARLYALLGVESWERRRVVVGGI